MSWRNLRTCSKPQRQFLDALTNQGKYAATPVARPRVLYGGSGFSGKSYCLRTAAVELNMLLASMGFTGQWGALFCKRYTDLQGRHIGKLIEEPAMAALGVVKRTEKRGLHFEFHDKNLGGFYLRNAQDPSMGRGTEFPWVLIDELTEFTREENDHICYMHRSPLPIPFLAYGAATNPDGPGHGWVKDQWIERKFSGLEELISKGLIDPEAYRFVGAKPSDNPAFNDEVAAVLQGFEDPLLVQSRWLGSWDLNMGSRFSRYSKAIHSFEWDEMLKANGFAPTVDPWAALAETNQFTIYGSLDFGTDRQGASALYLHAIDHLGRVWTFHEEYMRGMWLDQQANVIRKLLNKLPIRTIYCDPALSSKDSDGISRLDKFYRAGIRLVPGINNRVEGWSSLDALLAYRHFSKTTGEDILGSELEHYDPSDISFVPPRWRIHRYCDNLHKALASAPRDDRNPEDVSHKFREDHALDSVRYFLHTHIGRTVARPEAPAFGSMQWLKRRRGKIRSNYV